MEVLRLDITVPLRTFTLELELNVGNETVALVGPSGAGKSTVLRAIAGLVRPTRGLVALDADTWYSSVERLHKPPEDRAVGLVFQEYALFPHMTVRKNIAYGRGRRADEIMRRLRIEQLGDEKPGQLSGGERQRVALARALARDPAVLLLDEPLSALDAHTKAAVRSELRELLRDLALPTLLVTHDFEDAALLADWVGVIDSGKLIQCGRPENLVAAPANSFVASLIGANVLEGYAHPKGDLTAITLDDGSTVYSSDAASGRVAVVVYPWEIALSLAAPDDSSLNHILGVVGSLTTIDNRTRVRIGRLTAEVTRESADRLRLVEGKPIVASFKATATRALPLGLRPEDQPAGGDTP
jgi:molybdate transport system ATP-binding protein